MSVCMSAEEGGTSASASASRYAPGGDARASWMNTSSKAEMEGPDGSRPARSRRAIAGRGEGGEGEGRWHNEQKVAE